MKSTMLLIVALIAMPRCMAYTDAEMYNRTNLWYGSDMGRTPLDDMMEEVSDKPVSMTMQEYRAIQATNQTPLLAEVIASNIAYAVQTGQSTNGVTWTKADEIRLRILPPPEPREDWMHQSSRHLMMLMGVSAGDMSAVCTNWFMPKNICLDGAFYVVNRKGNDRFEIHPFTNAQKRVANGHLYKFDNGKKARVEGFLTYNQNVGKGQIGTAFGLSVNILDPATNMMFLCSKKGVSPPCDVLIYKNLVLRMSAETNALDFAAAIINEGLPEEDRIPLSPTP